MAHVAYKKALFLLENGFCEREFTQAQRVLKSMGYDCRISSSSTGLIYAWKEEKQPVTSNWSNGYAPNYKISDVVYSEYDVLVILGGYRSTEKLKLTQGVKPIISSFLKSNKPVIAYNYGVDLLGFYDLLRGYSVAVKGNMLDVVRAAGGRPAATEFVVSKNLISLTRYRDVDDKIRHAIYSILKGEKYFEQVCPVNGTPHSNIAA